MTQQAEAVNPAAEVDDVATHSQVDADALVKAGVGVATHIFTVWAPTDYGEPEMIASIATQAALDRYLDALPATVREDRIIETTAVCDVR